MSDLYTMNDVVNGLKTVIDQREARIKELEAVLKYIDQHDIPKHLHLNITLALQEDE